MSYEVTLLVFGILLLLIGLIGKVKAQQLEVGTDNAAARAVIAVLGAVLVVFSLDPDIVRSRLSGAKNETPVETTKVEQLSPPPFAPNNKTPVETAKVEGPSPPRLGPKNETRVENPRVEPSRTPPQDAANDFRNLEVSETSPSELRVSVDYTYTGDMGEHPPIQASVTANGRPNTGMVYEHVRARAKVGTASAAWIVYGDLRSQWESDEIQFCFVDTSREHPPFCKSLPYRKPWPVARFQRVTENQISNFQTREVSGKELLVSANYQYKADGGERPFRVYMSAVALQANGQQVPRTHFEGLGGPGAVRVGTGRSTMLIDKYTDQPATSESVRFCINAQNQQGNLSQVLCEVFPHHKEWR